MDGRIEAEAENLLNRIIQLVGLYDTQSEFARVTGLTRQSISIIVSKTVKNLSFTTIYQIAKGTGCNVEWLILGIGHPFSKTKDSSDIIEEKDLIVNLNNVIDTIRNDDILKTKETITLIRDLCEMYLQR